MAKNIIGLQTPAGRLVFFVFATVIIFVLPQSILGEFSVWARFGLDNVPSVGLTRAYNYVLHGNLSDAWAGNSLIFVVLAIGIPLLVNDVLNIIPRKR